MNSMTIESDVRRLLALVTQQDVAHVPANSNLAEEIALDSLSRLELLAEIEDELDVTLSDEEVQDVATINDIVEIAKQHLH